jgi:hypothetical protein
MFGHMRSPHALSVFVLGLLLIGAGNAAAQSGSSSNGALSGVVRRASDHQPLPGVEVWLPSQDLRALTDSSGAYRLTGLTSGIAIVQLRRVGFDARRDTVTIPAQGDTQRDFVLFAQGTTLDTVRTVASGTHYMAPRLQAFEARRTEGGGKFIGDSVFRANDERSLASIVLQHVPGVQLVYGQAGAQHIASTRKQCEGPAFGQTKCRPCFVTTYLDGVPIYDGVRGDAGPPPPDANRIPNSELTGLEYYAGGASLPPQFVHTSTGCGVLMLWTRER